MHSQLYTETLVAGENAGGGSASLVRPNANSDQVFVALNLRTFEGGEGAGYGSVAGLTLQAPELARAAAPALSTQVQTFVGASEEGQAALDSAKATFNQRVSSAYATRVGNIDEMLGQQLRQTSLRSDVLLTLGSVNDRVQSFISAPESWGLESHQVSEAMNLVRNANQTSGSFSAASQTLLAQNQELVLKLDDFSARMANLNQQATSSWQQWQDSVRTMGADSPETIRLRDDYSRVELDRQILSGDHTAVAREQAVVAAATRLMAAIDANSYGVARVNQVYTEASQARQSAIQSEVKAYLNDVNSALQNYSTQVNSAVTAEVTRQAYAQSESRQAEGKFSAEQQQVANPAAALRSLNNTNYSGRYEVVDPLSREGFSNVAKNLGGLAGYIVATVDPTGTLDEIRNKGNASFGRVAKEVKDQVMDTVAKFAETPARKNFDAAVSAFKDGATLYGNSVMSRLEQNRSPFAPLGADAVRVIGGDVFKALVNPIINGAKNLTQPHRDVAQTAGDVASIVLGTLDLGFTKVASTAARVAVQAANGVVPTLARVDLPSGTTPVRLVEPNFGQTSATLAPLPSQVNPVNSIALRELNSAPLSARGPFSVNDGYGLGSMNISPTIPAQTPNPGLDDVFAALEKEFGTPASPHINAPVIGDPSPTVAKPAGDLPSFTNPPASLTRSIEVPPSVVSIAQVPTPEVPTPEVPPPSVLVSADELSVKGSTSLYQYAGAPALSRQNLSVGTQTVFNDFKNEPGFANFVRTQGDSIDGRYQSLIPADLLAAYRDAGSPNFVRHISVNISDPGGLSQTFREFSELEARVPDINLRVLNLSRGDTVVANIAGGGQTEMVLGKFLGAGNTSHIFALADDPTKVVRLPFTSAAITRAEGDPFFNNRNFVETRNMFEGIRNLEVPQIHSYGANHEFIVVDRVTNFKTLDSLYDEAAELEGRATRTAAEEARLEHLGRVIFEDFPKMGEEIARRSGRADVADRIASGDINAILDEGRQVALTQDGRYILMDWEVSARAIAPLKQAG